VRPIVCLVTPPTPPAELAALADRIGDAARAGLDLIQIRQPQLDARSLGDLVHRALDAVCGTHARVIVNDRLDVALATGAHGVHLREDSVPAMRVRAVAPHGFLLGRSVHSVSGAVTAASAGGLDYLIFGTVFQTSSKPGQAPVGAAALAEAVAATPLPVLAIGGVTLARLAEVAGTGASGLAAVGLFATADMTDTVRHVHKAWQHADPRSLPAPDPDS